jgi:hypothetical protein
MRRSTIAGLAVVLAAMAMACGPLMPTPTTGPIGSPLTPKQPLMAEFDHNLATWQASGIDRYAFTYTPFCFCMLGSHLIVSDGTEIRIDGVAVGAMEPPSGAPVGVDGLFAIVQRAIKGDYATIGYDESTGVPMTMDSDPIGNGIDDEMSFKVSDWTLDPPDDRVLGRIVTARRLWDRQGLPDYNWSIAVECKCQDDGRRFDITVRDGEIATVQSGTKQIAFDPIDPVEPFSVARLFDVTTYSATTVETTIEFDATFGYPTLVEIHDDRPDAITFWSLRVLSFAVQ